MALVHQADANLANEIATAFTAKDFESVLAEQYRRKFTDQELDEVTRYYRSSVGQKFLTVAAAAHAPLLDLYAARGQQAQTQATAAFTARLREIAKTCTCTVD
jgi:hypothetical protein